MQQYLSPDGGPMITHVLFLIDKAVLVHDPLPQVPVVNLHLVGSQAGGLQGEIKHQQTVMLI